jgi:hypothetical protein
MFEKAIVRNTGTRDVDIGTIAETIFFYGKTHLLLNRGVIHALTQLPQNELLELSSRDCLNLSYVKPMFGINTTGGLRVHSFAAYEVHAKGKSTRSTYQDEILSAFYTAYGQSRATRKSAQNFTDRVKLFAHSDFNDDRNIVCELAAKDAVDLHFVHAAVVATLQSVAPKYVIPPNFRFDIFDTGDGYAVNTNLDFLAITKAAVPPYDQGFTDAHILALIQDARADTFFAAHYMAELVTTDWLHDIIKLKHYDWLRRGDKSQDEIANFVDLTSNNFPTIREAIISGSRSITDFLKLLDQAEKFKSWLQSTNPDQGLLNAYFREATKESWADKIPSKSIRIAALTLAGLAVEAVFPTGLAISSTTALSAADAFLLERITKGWRPTNFISGPYRKFIDPGHT